MHPSYLTFVGAFKAGPKGNRHLICSVGVLGVKRPLKKVELIFCNMLAPLNEFNRKTIGRLSNTVELADRRAVKKGLRRT